MSLFYKVKGDDLRGKESADNDVLVKIHHSINYNGGTVVDGKWYAGYEVDRPIVPKGYELFSIGEGSQLNAHPPYTMMILRKVKTNGRHL